MALVEEDAVDDALDGLVDRRVLEDDVGGLAAQFEGHLLARRCAGPGDLLADLGGAGERHLVDARMGDQRAASVPRTGEDVDHAGRKVGLLADLGEGQRGQRRGLGGLEHHRVAASQRGRDLPGQHEQREVPRDDLPGHAQGFRRRAIARVFELVGPARVVEEVCRDRGGPRRAIPDRLAVVERLEHGQFAGAFLDDPGDAEQVLAAFHGRQHGPDVFVGLAGGGHRAVHVGRAGLGHLGQDLLGGGRDGLERAAVRAGPELPVDEQPVGLLDGDDPRDSGAGAYSNLGMSVQGEE